MFAVPGWNLSAPLKTQVEDPAAKKNAGESKKSKKRKREKKEAEDVNEANVGEIFDKIVAPKEDVPNANGENEGTSEVHTAEGAEEAPAKKKRKRGKKKPKPKNGADCALDKDIEKNDSATVNGNTPKPKGKGANSEPVAARQQKPNEEQKLSENGKSAKPPKKNAPKAIEPPTTLASTLSLLPEPKGLTPLQRSMRIKLASARFRHLNESLYTKPSAESLSIFKDSPEMFEEYHRGFQQQVEVWPENPVDVYVQAILSRGKVRLRDAWKDKKRNDKKRQGGAEEQPQDSASPALKPLPRSMKGHATIADLGCGTAALAYTLQPHLKNLNLTIHSFDLSKPSGPSGPLVTIADISALPLPDSSVDVAVFCLALMGTNWLDFVDEAYRILRWRGELWVAEIKSRFGRVNRKGKPPINSVGSLRKDAAPKKNVTRKGREKAEPEGPQNSDDEEQLATHVDGVEGPKNETDVSAFVEVMRKRGFVLDQEEKMSVDMRNKMFVRMQFVKAAAPVKGKNVKKDDGEGAARGAGKGKKFIQLDEEDEGDEKDAATLKPCLYKVR
jgi:ribosomal RNA-processing protein 8